MLFNLIVTDPPYYFAGNSVIFNLCDEISQIITQFVSWGYLAKYSKAKI